MKTIIFSLILASGIISTKAQNLLIKDQSNNVLNSTTVTVAVASATDLASVNYNILNTASTSLSVKVRRIENSLVAGSINYFCWAGNCYSSQTSVSPFSANISSNQTSPFIGDYDPNGNAGSSSITYIFYDATNLLDSSFVTVLYSTQIAGIKNHTKNSNLIQVYPNPAQDILTVSFSQLNAKESEAIIYDSNGNKINSFKLHSQRENIDIKNLSSGKYMVLISDGKNFLSRSFIKN